MRHFLVILSLTAMMASALPIVTVTPDFSHYILKNNQNMELDVCAVEITPTGVQLSIEGILGRTIQAACWQTIPAAEHLVTACGAVQVSRCIPHTTGQPGPNDCASNSPAGQLNNGAPSFHFTECVNIFLTGSGQGVVLNITGLELDELGQLGVFSFAGDVGQARFLSDKACNTSLNNYPHAAGDVEASLISYPYPPSDTCIGCMADPCAPTPGGLTVGCCLTNSSVAGAFCPNASGCVEIPAEDCENLNGTVVADECPSTSNEFEQFACESRACCRGNMCESNVFVAKCLEDGGTPLDVVNCPVTVTGGMSGGMGSLNGNPCQLTGCCGGRGEDLGVEGNHANPPPAGMGDTRPACRSDLPAGSCRLLGGAPLNSNCSQGMNDERCACCLDVKKKCLQRMDNLGANQDGHGSGNFWADMFGNPQNDGNNLGSNTGSSGSNNYDWISMGSLNGGSLVTMDGARFDQFDDKKGTGSMMMNNVRFELREECETKCDECRNGTFVIILINHCNVDLEDVRVVDTAAGVTITKFVDVPRAKDGRNGIKALFIDRCVACGLENDVEVTSPLQVNAGMSTTIVGDAFCVLHDSAEFEVNNARNDDKPFQPFNPGSNDGHNNGQGPLLGPSPPWAQRPGTLFGRVP